MEIIEPNVELIENKDSIAHVARCARVCYGKETGNDELTVGNLMQNEHYSMFRHDTKYYIIPESQCNISIKDLYTNISNGNTICGIDIKYSNRFYYVVINGNYFIDHNNFCSLIRNYKVSDKEFENTEIGYSMMRYTFLITTQISTSRELNRVSPNNIAEQSTRYVLEDGVICRPHWITEDDIERYFKFESYNVTDNTCHYLSSCEDSFVSYKCLVNRGVKKQDARGVLPLDTATKVIYTYSVDEWRHIINLRADKAAHPNAQIIANMIKDKLIELGYGF